ncbi:ABC transporter substrate-binding protein [Frankia nepalensis]|uniref:ABC transporter substrate-binding protein n=1 Tax=Frankia nepalensis TaxID=1836974 RepID=UPI0027DE7816|nr:ABC transporter substrate-binding protein [Frankia nepalensis]
MTPTEVKVGLVYPDSGPVGAGFRYARSGVEARIALANASGGVNGRKIVLEWRDDQGNTSGFARAADDLLRAGVFGLIAETLFVADTADRLDKEGVPVAGVPGEAVWTQHRNMFTFGSLQAAGSSVTTFGLYLRRFGATRAALVFNDTQSRSAEGLVRLFTDSLRSQGIAVADPIGYTPGITSPDRVAAQIKALDADAFVGIVSGEDLPPIYTAAKRAGLTFKVALASSGYDTQFLARHGASMAGVSVLTPHVLFTADSPALHAYRQAVIDHAPELDQTDNEIALGAYITTDEFLLGLELAGACPTRAAFIDNLRAVRDYDAGGLIPTTDLSRFGDPNLCYSFVRVNQTGTAFEVVPGVGGPDPHQWCGTRLGA